MFRIGNLAIDDVNYNKTVIYFLKKPSHLSFCSTIIVENTDWFVGVGEDSKTIYASTNAKLSKNEDYFSFSFLAVQRLLDMAILIGKPAMSVESDKNKQILFLISIVNGKKNLSLYAKDFLKFEINVKIEARDLEGNLIHGKSPMSEYKQSVRYFRMSQLSESLLDAYRYLYLSVESALNDLHPKLHKDGEMKWISKAISLANSRSKTPLIYKGYSTIGEYFIDYHYKQFRLKLFHSKKDVLLPLDLYDLTDLYNAYIDLFEICSMIFDVQYSFNIKGGSHFTEHGIKAAIEGLVVNRILFFNDRNPVENIFKVDKINQFHAQGYKGHLKFELDVISSKKNSFNRYEIGLDEEVYITLDFDEKIEFEGFDYVIINHEVMYTNRNIIDRPFLW